MKKALVIIWTVTLVYMAYTLMSYFIESSHNKKLYQELRDHYNRNALLKQEFSSVSDKDNKKVIMERYHTILSINQDVVGWIKVPNTRIDYPVLKTKDNDFYMYHNLYKEIAKAGSIFMDFRNQGKAEELHTILYGHNMKDGSMFRDLVKYKNQDFLNENPVIAFHTLYEEVEWEIFSVYVTDINFHYIRTDFKTLNDYEEFLKSIRERSLFDIDLDVSVKDAILTLSTCSYDFDNARLVIHAKKIHNEGKFSALTK